jgi:acetolactate synthase-1/2/3 large subunit
MESKSLHDDGDDQIKTSDLLVDILIKEGVKFIFGIPGEENLDLVESLRKRKDQIQLVLVRHEQAAGFMAATIGRLTGQPGVALSTLGPGATNFTTAVAVCYLGGFPALFLTGQKPIKESKQADFQIINVVEIMKPIVKYTRSIPAGNLLAASVRCAFSEAVAEKPGPVHIELAEDVAAEWTSKNVFSKMDFRRPIAEGKAVTAAYDILKHAVRPVFILGAAANRQRAVTALRDFVNETNIFWCSTQMGKGSIDERHPGFLGCTALSDKDYVHGALDLSDVIVMVGHDESEKPPFVMSPTGKRKVIHISFSPVIVSNVYWPTVQVVGDIANAVWQIHEKIRENKKTWNNQGCFRRYKELTDKLILQGQDDDAFPMNVARVVSDLRKIIPGNGILSLDNGLYKVVAARLYKAHEPNTVLLDNALASMGAGIPGAIGCKFLYPDRPVVSLSGDGGAQMNLPELATCMQYKLNIVHVILNDNAFGMIKWKQGTSGFQDFGLDLQNPDFAALARSYGASGHRVTDAKEFAPLLQQCLDAKGTHVIEVPFSYEWMAAQLKEIPGDIKRVTKQVEDEFGDCYIECSLGSEK